MAANLPSAVAPPSSPTTDHTRPSRSIPPDSLLNYLREVNHGRCPDKPAFISAMKTFAHISGFPSGKTIHAHITKSGLAADRFVATSIIAFYSACGLLRSARQLFDRIPDKDAVLWTAMLVSYAKNGDIAGASKLFDEFPVKDLAAWNAMLSSYLRCGFPQETLKLLHKMQAVDEITLIIALTACSRIGFLDFGEQIHGYIIKIFHRHRSATSSNSLVNMYAKCGQFDAALAIFIGQESKNLESWNALLSGCAVSGLAQSSSALFSQMVKSGVCPNEITLLALLMACSHAGKVVDAFRYFTGFAGAYGVEPGAEHCGCLVDALSRSGQLEEARRLIEGMALDSDASCWGALLRGCFAHHQNHELGLEAAERLLELEPRDEGRHIALSNLVAVVGEVGDAMKVRKKMIDMGIKRTSGVSLIESGGEFQKFQSGDRSHAQSMHVYAAIESLHSNMRLDVLHPKDPTLK